MSQLNPASADPQIDPQCLYSRLPGESKKAFDAFVIFRDLGGARSIPLVARQLGSASTRYIEAWSAKYNWPGRVDAFDRDIETDQLKIKMAAERELYVAKLKQYNQHHEAIGSAGLAFVSNYMIVANFLLKPLVAKVNNKTNLSPAEEKQFYQLRRLRDVFPIAEIASQFMGEALHIKRLVEQLEAAENGK